MGGWLPDPWPQGDVGSRHTSFIGHISGVPLGCQARPQGGTGWVHPAASPSDHAGTNMESVRCYTGPWVLEAGD